MSNKFKIGHGSQIEVGRIDAANSLIVTYTTLSGVQDVQLPNSTRDEVEVTHQGSGGVREFTAGLIDNGEVSIEMNWEPNSATDTLLKEIKTSGETVQLRFKVGPTAVANTFSVTETYVSFCKGYERMAPVADKMTATASFRISGLVS